MKHPAESPQTLSFVVGIVFTNKNSVGGSVCLAAVNPPTCLQLPSEHPTVSRLPLPESPTVATSPSRRVSSSGAEQQEQPREQVERNQHRPCQSGNSLQLLPLSCNKLYIIAKKGRAIDNRRRSHSRSSAAKVSLAELRWPRTFCGNGNKAK